MFLAIRRRNKGRFCFDVTMEESDIIDINKFGTPIISTKTSQKLLKCDKITYVPISGFLPVTKKMNPGILVLLETFRSNFEFFLTSPTARFGTVSRKTKIPGFIFLSPKNPDIGT